MSKYSGIYCCGHEGCVQIYGPVKDRQGKADWIFSQVCPDCAKKKHAEQFKKREKEAIEKAIEMDLPQLVGTLKQTAWANTLRIEFIDKFNNLLNRLQDSPSQTFQFVNQEKRSQMINFNDLLEVFNFLCETKVDAEFWIKNRNESFNHLSQAIILDWLDKKMEQDIPAEVKNELEHKQWLLTVKPENRDIKGGIVIISIDNSNIKAEYEKDIDFCSIVKELRFFWDGHAWKKEITEFTGPAQNRGAELGNELLRAGFTVRFPNKEMMEMAISGDFGREHTRWIRFDPDSEKLAIRWADRNENLYQAAIKIPGARYSNGQVLVPIGRYLEVEDFANTLNFQFSKLAQEKINSFKAEEVYCQSVCVAKVLNDIPDEKKLETLLKKSGIIEELKDET